MKAARIWLGFFVAAFAVLFVNFVLTLSTQPAYGDLTRIAQISDREFGWKTVPPSIPYQYIVNTPIEQADVLVIGDSFSMFFAWQSVLVQAGYRVATTHWDNIGAVCDDFAPWLRRSGFTGKLVVIESIERVMPLRLSHARDCRTMSKPFSTVPIPPESPSAPPPHFKPNWNGQVFSGFKVWRNTRRIHTAKDEVVFNVARYGDSVYSSPVPQGCARFSHRFCEQGLFLVEDRIRRELDASDAQDIHRFIAQAAPLKMLWMVIPDKTTVYLAPTHGERFVQRANELGIGPDLFAMARDMRSKMVDLYWSNDGHWSMQGQVYFGGQMLKVVQTAIGAPARSGHTP